MSGSLDESLSPTDNYLTQNYILEYLSDSVQQLLEYKNFDPKIDVLEFFTEYFKNVLLGNHILFREYDFIVSTPYNRSCFIQKFVEAFFNMISREDLINTYEFHALVLLMCNDFPFDIVEKSLKIASQVENPVVLFKDFIYLFQFQFYFKEFVEDFKDIYKNVEKLASQNKNENPKKHDKKDSDITFYLNALIENLQVLENKVTYSFPSINTIKVVTLNQKDLDFYDLIQELAFNETIIKQIGKLPVPNKLSDYQEQLAKNQISNKPKEANQEEKKSILNSKASLSRQKSYSNISTSLSKTFSDNSDSSKTSSSDSSSDTDT